MSLYEKLFRQSLFSYQYDDTFNEYRRKISGEYLVDRGSLWFDVIDLSVDHIQGAEVEFFDTLVLITFDCGQSLQGQHFCWCVDFFEIASLENHSHWHHSMYFRLNHSAYKIKAQRSSNYNSWTELQHVKLYNSQKGDHFVSPEYARTLLGRHPSAINMCHRRANASRLKTFAFFNCKRLYFTHTPSHIHTARTHSSCGTRRQKPVKPYHP